MNGVPQIARIRAALDEIEVRDSRIRQVVASLHALRGAMDAEYESGKESLFRTWSLQVGYAIAALSTPTLDAKHPEGK